MSNESTHIGEGAVSGAENRGGEARAATCDAGTRHETSAAGGVEATRHTTLPKQQRVNPFAPVCVSPADLKPDDAHVRVEKIATTLRELETTQAHLVFRLDEPIGGNAGSAGAPAADVPATQIYRASCVNATLPELARCVLKACADAELAKNEWHHLTTYRNPLFPTPFVFARLEDGRHAIIMELIEGPTLQQLISEGFGEDRGPAPVEKALEIMSPLAASFKVLSQTFRSFVHRDIKPANIVISDGPCKTRLIDLGIAAHERDLLQHLHAGATPGYAPPEIEHPETYPAHDLASYCDTRIDTYELAATLFALLTGRPPRDGENPLRPERLRHDKATITAIHEQAKRNILSKHGRTVDDALLGKLVAQAARRSDERLVDLLNRSLSFQQTKRPTPAEFFDELPANYTRVLVDRVQVLFLEHLANQLSGQGETERPTLNTVGLAADEAIALENTPLSNSYRYDGFYEDFQTALDAWNRGDYVKAVPLLKRLEKVGDSTAQYNLGICYRDGLGGITPDASQKLAYWTRAAEAGNIVAAYNVAVCHERGDGIPATPDAALKWYRHSARGGFPLAQQWMDDHGHAF